jgi:nucleotide-binding universal stress UspA family protein
LNVEDKDMDAENNKLEDTTTITSTSTSSKPQVSSSYINPQYTRILVPHDGSEMSDRALSHAAYLSKTTGAEIVILHVVEHIAKIDSSSLLATSKGGEGEKDIEKSENQDFEIRVEGGAKQMIEEKMRFCKQAGVKSQVSYRIQTGKPVDEIVKLSDDVNADLIVMASKRISSIVKGLGSTARKVIDAVERPVLVVHE